MTAASRAAKKALVDAALLAHPQEKAEICLALDARNHHVGAALQQ